MYGYFFLREILSEFDNYILSNMTHCRLSRDKVDKIYFLNQVITEVLLHLHYLHLFLYLY